MNPVHSNEEPLDYVKEATRLVSQKNSEQLVLLLRSLKDGTLLESFSRAKITKTIRVLLDSLAQLHGTHQAQLSIVQELLDWASADNRLYLKIFLELRLASIYLDLERYGETLERTASLMKELRRMDDKPLIVEVYLLESKAYHALHNMPKSKATLVSARALSNTIYCPPTMQASLDIQSAFDALSGLADDPRTPLSLKYLLLAEEIDAILGLKNASRWSGDRDICAICEVARASTQRSLAAFEKALGEYDRELAQDPVIRTHLHQLYDLFLEKNVSKLVEPYSRVQLSFLASEINLSVDILENRLSKMILDKIIFGMIDQGSGCLEIFGSGEDQTDQTDSEPLAAVVENVVKMDTVVDALYKKASMLLA